MLGAEIRRKRSGSVLSGHFPGSLASEPHPRTLHQGGVALPVRRTVCVLAFLLIIQEDGPHRSPVQGVELPQRQDVASEANPGSDT